MLSLSKLKVTPSIHMLIMCARGSESESDARVSMFFFCSGGESYTLCYEAATTQQAKVLAALFQGIPRYTSKN